MNIALDTALMTATLTGDANSATPTPIKPSLIPVTITCTANGSPSTFPGTPGLSIGLTESTGAAPATLAWLDTFTDASSVFTGTLDGNDTRLVTFLANGPQALNVEVAISINGGDPMIFPNMQVLCQQRQNPGGSSSQGGPSYPTTVQMTAAIAAALGLVLDGNGNILIGTHARLTPSPTGLLLETSANGTFSDAQITQSWPQSMNLGAYYICTFPGNPTGAPLREFDAPQSAIVIDTVDNVILIKTTSYGDNSGFSQIPLIDPSGNMMIGSAARLRPTLTGCILETFDGTKWNPSQSWP